MGVGGGGWEDELKNKTNLSQSLVEVEAEQHFQGWVGGWCEEVKTRPNLSQV